jgi:hypothetical protein
VLRPNVNGLTHSQLRVYSDFSKLNQRTRVEVSPQSQQPAQLQNSASNDGRTANMQTLLSDQSNQKARDPPTLHAFTLETIF